MPHINRIRVNNVKYNFGTQFYDDFMMRFSCKNTIYDLANGGGKSVLMLLLMQNLIPNCTLDEKQPVEKLFRGDGSQVIHSLIEWKLNKNNVKDGYQYMTTGFCARKAKETGQEENTPDKENTAIEYFNYCIFYREFNDNDIRNLPLSNGKERITYQGLRNYLRDLEKKDYSLEVKIFDRKGDYQRFISRYGLYESEWEIIRGINKTEGHVRTYFETHYKTTRKVVEDLLIEEIIQKSFQYKIGEEGDSNEIAKTLLDIKDKLVELSRKKGEMNHYDLQTEVLQGFIRRLQSMKGVYLEKSSLEAELLKTYRTALSRRAFKKEQLEKSAVREEELGEEEALLQRQVESVRIQAEEESLRKLEEEAESTGKLLEQYRETLKLLDNSIKKAESGNDYLDYLEDKKQLVVQEEAMKAALSEKEGLLTELYELTAAIKKKRTKRTTQLAGDLEKAKELKKSSEEEVKLLRQQQGEKACRIAVLESRYGENEKVRAGIAEELAEKQKITGVLLEIHAEEALAENRRQQKELEAERNQLEVDKISLEETYGVLVMDIADRKRRRTLAAERMEEVKRYLEEYRNDRDKAEHLRTIYKEYDFGRTMEKIYGNLRNILLKKEELKKEIRQEQELIEALKQGIPMVLPEKTGELADYISRHHGVRVLTGAEYLAGREGFERDVLLENFPMLPYALLVEGHFAEISEDIHIARADYGNSPIPVISMEALKLEEGLKQDAYICYVGKETELFLQEEKQEALFKTAQEALSEKEKRLQKTEEDEDVLKEDYDFICRFFRGYGKKLQEYQQEYENERSRAEILAKEEESLETARECNTEERKNNSEALEKLEESRQKLLEEERILTETQKLLESHAKAVSEEQKLAQSLAAEKKQKDAQAARLTALEFSLEENRKTVGMLQEKKDAAERDWEVLYGAYDKPGYEAETGLELEELEIRFLGRKSAFEKENGDLEDKKLLVENLKESMERALAGIEYRGIPMEELEQAYSENRLFRTGREELLKKRQQLKETKEAEELAVRTLQGQTEGINRKFGSISHAKRMVEERFGGFTPVVLEGVTFGDFLKANTERLKQLETKIRETKAAAKDLEKQCFALESMCGDMERMMKQTGMKESGENDEIWDLSVSLKEKYEELRNRYDKLGREEQRRRETFEQDKAKLVETLQKLNAHAFADELRRTMVNPAGSEEAERLIAGLTESISYIELEKNRVGKGIEDMEVIKANFENQCLQTCLTIKSELERLPGMSNIRLDEKSVPMIQLSIPYIREEQYQEAMSAYIDEIVENTEGFRTPEEKLRYIRSQLAFKRLFSVIVKDMNLIRLTLYKRERIKEQSRYLKYEEAVGSTGQSQGIYIQFLIAIIHYITSINSSNAEPTALKNVIFIDNPFGAAKDVYIWEPIFKLLKNNNVQLIVPARGATPAITGRFEVNYILGQKLVDGKQQTVVVDYRSQMEEEEVEYKPLEFEQAELF